MISMGCVIGLDFLVALTREHNLTSVEGVMQSTNYPENYEDNEIVQWTVAAIGANFIKLVIFDFSTQSDNDYLEIQRGPGINGEPIAKLTGDNIGTLPYTYTALDTNLFLRFFSDGEITSRNDRGFNAGYFPGIL